MIRKKSVIGALAALVLGVTPAAIGAASAAESPAPSWCSSPRTEVIDADQLPATLSGCDLTGRLVRKGKVALYVQPPGEGIGYHEDGIEESVTFILGTRPDGTVEVDRSTHVHSQASNSDPGPVDLSPEPDPCLPSLAGAYAKLGWKAYSTLNWYYNPSGEPAAVSGSALTAITNASLNVADGHNDCGFTNVPRTSFATYIGPTTRVAEVPYAATAYCPSSPDSYSVMSWGALQSALAATCWKFDYTRSPTAVVASDIKINPSYPWTSRAGLLCVAGTPLEAFDLEAVMTHEWGHSFGLDHVSESGATKSQTMSTQVGVCDPGPSTLGRGDFNGMISLYGSL